MARMGVRIAVAGLALLTAGCVSNDPRRGGFVGGVAGLWSGQYDENVAAQRAELQQAREGEGEEQRASLSLAQDRDRHAGEKARLTREATALDRDLAALRRRIRGLQDRAAVNAAQASELDRQIAALQEWIAAVQADPALDPAERSRQLDESKRKIAGLRAQAEAYERAMKPRSAPTS
ncbi:hypothetical protein [Azospirillum agricola]|uniref:hypothetical protein n=1 Tax=Azospirillum agricola TaxID=1720247 RepID=UPI000A0F25A4|nr:hypothetical protein [Azospirillum agricola]SMH47857.1 hypothetical protein SAMN02982994_2671 [Azospirillum lipoferum]